MNEIDCVFTKYPFFDSCQINACLPRSGASRVATPCASVNGCHGIQAIYKGPNSSKKHQQYKIYPYFLRNLSFTRSNQVWYSDNTYIPMQRSFLYLVAIMD